MVPTRYWQPDQRQPDENMQNDYCQAFATLLQDWLGAIHGHWNKPCLEDFMNPGLWNASTGAEPACQRGGSPLISWWFPQTSFVFPNPASYSTEVSAEHKWGDTLYPVTISLHSMGGQLISQNWNDPARFKLLYLMYPTREGNVCCPSWTNRPGNVAKLRWFAAITDGRDFDRRNVEAE